MKAIKNALLLCLLIAALAAGQQTAASAKPKLILAIVVDQFRYDYLTRYRAE